MTSGKANKAARRASKAVVVNKRSFPWGSAAAIAVVVALAATIGVYFVTSKNAQSEQVAALAPFTPTAQNQDPSKTIPGIVTAQNLAQGHVERNQNVAYTHSPPFGGAHDAVWASCNGVVYPNPVRTENMVHALEHGTVWIAYDAARVTGAARDALAAKVKDHPYTIMSPYPGLDAPISLQSWGHQLKLDDAADPRIDQFITALRHNQYTYPEVGASCQEVGPGPDGFVESDPPPFVPAPKPGTPGAVDETFSANRPTTPETGVPGQ